VRIICDICVCYSGGKFITIGDRIRLPDDVTMGYIIEYLLKKQLTVVEQFHSHLEPMKFLNKDTFHEQVISTRSLPLNFISSKRISYILFFFVKRISIIFVAIYGLTKYLIVA